MIVAIFLPFEFLSASGYEFLETPIVSIHYFLSSIIIGILIIVLFAIWIYRAKIKGDDKFIFMACVAWMVLTISSPAAIVLTQITGIDGLQTYQYRHQGHGTFKPVNSNYPELRLRDSKYWRTFPKNTIHQFELRKGWLGFYQIDTKSIDREIHEYEKL